jgi:putative hemin transport protein
MNLMERYASLQHAQPHLRPRDAAAALGVTEAELVGASPDSHQLTPDWQTLFARLPELGRVMALTRNETVVHERRGTYLPPAIGSAVMGAVLGPEIDLRLFFSSWASAFAVTREDPRGPQRSLQLFDRHGTAVHKIHLLPESDVQAWSRLTIDLAGGAPVHYTPRPAPPRPAPDAMIDVLQLQSDWAALQDTHEFHPMLQRLGVARRQALRLGGAWARWGGGIEVVQRALAAAARDAVPIMAFVGNPGCIQIHAGPITRVVLARGWTNVLDEAFNLHVHDARVADVWVVHKPTRDGIVSSVEAFDEDGELVLQLFGVRKEGPEDPRWRALTDRLPEG